MHKTLFKATLFIMIITSVGVSLSWWNTNWQYRQPIQIQGNISDNTTLTAQLELDTKRLIQKQRLRNNCKDLRIVTKNETNPIKVRDCDEVKTTILTEIKTQNHKENNNQTNKSNNKTTNQKNHYLYYGNPKATNKTHNLTTGYQNNFETNIFDGDVLEKIEEQRCNGPSNLCALEDEYTFSKNNQLKEKNYHLKSEAVQDFTRSSRQAITTSSLLIKEPLFMKNQSRTVYISTGRKYWTYSYKNTNTRSTYSIYITDGDTDQLLFQEKRHERGNSIERLFRNSIGRIRYDEEKQEISYGYNWNIQEEDLNNITMEELRNKGYTDEDREGNKWITETHTVNTTNLTKLKIKVETQAVSSGYATGTTSKASVETDIHFIKGEKSTNNSLGPEEALPYYNAEVKSITPNKPIQLNTTKIPLSAWINLENKGKTDQTNITIPFKVTNLNKSQIKNYADTVVSINSNETKRIPIQFTIPLEVEKTSTGTSQNKGEKIKITSNLENKIENVSFTHEKEDNWKNIELRKCKHRNTLNCSASNESDWNKVSYYIEDKNIVRKGDTLSELMYLINYQEEDSEEESEGDSGSSSGSTGSSGGSGGASTKTYAPEEELEEEQKEGSKNLESQINIINPRKSVEPNFKLKVSVLNDYNCIARLNSGAWGELTEKEGFLTKKYSEVDEGEHRIEVKCQYSSDSTLFTVKSEEKEQKEFKEEIELEKASKSNLNTIALPVLLSLGVMFALSYLVHVKNRD